MSKPHSITIAVDKPCNQSWNKMTPHSRGRYCAACQKTVIDFTAWSDPALYEFFAKKPEHVCGRFLSTQLDKPISIPHQPQSRLYHMTIALGLTLMCTQTPAVLAQNRPPKAAQNTSKNVAREPLTFAPGYGSIRGTITEQQHFLINATIEVYRGSILQSVNLSDHNGDYTTQPLKAGIYELKVSLTGYKTILCKNVTVASGDTVIRNARMTRLPDDPKAPYIMLSGAVGYPSGETTPIPSTARLSGHITDEHGKSLAGTEIQLYKNGSFLTMRQADASGAYDITGLDPGLYELKLFKEGHKLTTIKDVFIFTGKTEQNVTMVTKSVKSL